MQSLALTISSGLLLASVAHAQLPTYTSIYRLGMDGPEHTAANGVQQGQATRYYPSLDWVGGTSSRFTPAGVAAGQTAWIWSAESGTIRVGLIDAAHTRADGFRNSNPLLMSVGGFMAGWSDRYIGASAGGRSAWRATASSGTARLGLFDANHIRADGFQNSEPRFLSSGGTVVGWSDRYLGASAGGRSAWGATPSGGTIRLGYFDPDHTRADGFQNSEPRFLNSAGSVVGWSDRYIGATGTNRSAWIWNSASGLSRLGLTDAPYAASDGTQLSDTNGINALGQVVGYSHRYQGAGGTVAWIWSPESGYAMLGYTDAPHTSSSGIQVSSPYGLNDAGRVIGGSTAYEGAANLGIWGWTWTAAEGLTRVGLTDTMHTSSSGQQSTTVDKVLASGRVVGWSSRFPGGDRSVGTSAWTWTASSGTVQIGLYDAEHIRASDGECLNLASTTLSDDVLVGTALRYVNGMNTGVQTNWIWTEATGTVRAGLNDAAHSDLSGSGVVTYVSRAGQAVGYSLRTSSGLTGWLFHPLSGIQAIPEFSVSPTGESRTRPTLITDSGIVLGFYVLYGSSGDSTQRAFAWSPQLGLVDLGTAVPGGLGASGWSGLTSVVEARGTNRILGTGTRESPANTTPYVLAAASCAADFNNSGGISVQDIFDFLGAWFAGAQRADVNGMNGITVQDIFDFLISWFVGCP